MQLPERVSLVLDPRQSLALAALMVLPPQYRPCMDDQGVVVDHPVYIGIPNVEGSSVVAVHFPQNLVGGVRSLSEFPPEVRKKYVRTYQVRFDVKSGPWQHGHTYWKVVGVECEGVLLPVVFGEDPSSHLRAFPYESHKVA